MTECMSLLRGLAETQPWLLVAPAALAAVSLLVAVRVVKVIFKIALLLALFCLALAGAGLLLMLLSPAFSG